jgi:hypothetical protein
MSYLMFSLIDAIVHKMVGCIIFFISDARMPFICRWRLKMTGLKCMAYAQPQA